MMHAQTESGKAGERESERGPLALVERPEHEKVVGQPSPLDPRLSTPQGRVDLLQYLVGQMPQIDFPLRHRFTPGLYTREIIMPAGAIIISRIHKTTHPFVISAGCVEVWTEKTGFVRLRAPHSGITTPGTRRILVIHEDTIWTTFHPTQETDPDKLVAELTETPDVSYIGAMQGQIEELLRGHAWPSTIDTRLLTIGGAA